MFRNRNQSNNYGIGQNSEPLIDMAYRVCAAYDQDEKYAKKAAMFLMEIAAVETKLGKYWDKTKYAGMGITQIDKVCFDDVVKRTSFINKKIALEYFGVDINRAEWVELRHNPLLCFLFTRLFIKLWPELIPDTAEERSMLWKERYNTRAGKGTPEHYIASLNYIDAKFT